MKALEELAKGYTDNCCAIAPAEVHGVLYRETVKDFKAGYKAAFKWVSINDELPDSDRSILAMSDESKVVWNSSMEDGRIAPYIDLMFGEDIPATYWRELDLEY